MRRAFEYNVFETNMCARRATAQIVTIGVARCVWWCRCDALVCARSVSVDSAAMETIGVISMAAVLALGPGPRN